MLSEDIDLAKEMAWLTENGFIFMSSEKELLLSEMGQREAFRINKIRARQDFNRLINSATDNTAYLDYCEEIYGYRMYLFNMMDKQQLDYLFNAVTVTEHLKNIFTDGELEENSVCRKSRRTGADGKEYNTKFYNLEAVSVSLTTTGSAYLYFFSNISSQLNTKAGLSINLSKYFRIQKLPWNIMCFWRLYI